MYCYFLSLDMDGCHISDPHIPMRTPGYACVSCACGPALPTHPKPATPGSGCYQRVSSGTVHTHSPTVAPLSTLLLELVAAVERR